MKQENCCFFAALLLAVVSLVLAASPPTAAESTHELDLNDLRRDLFSADWMLRYAAYEQLLDAGAAALPMFVQAVGSEDPELRALGVSGLKQLGPTAAPAARVLADALEDDDEIVRLTAAWGLAEMGAVALDHLRARLSYADGYIRALAAWAVGRIGADAAPLVPELLELLADERTYVQWAAGDALAAIWSADEMSDDP